MIGCVGIADLEGDGTLQVVVVGDTELSSFRKTAGAWTRRDYALSESGAFVAGPPREWAYAKGCTAADLDGDKRTDLVVVGDKQAGVILWNEGGGRFSRAALPALPGPDDATTHSIALVPTASGRLDLYVGRNKRFSDFEAQGCRPDANGDLRCGDANALYTGAPNLYLRNQGARAFSVEDVGAADPHQSMAVTAVDLAGDGQVALVSCNDGHRNTVYGAAGVDRYVERGREWGFSAPNHCMGIDFADLDGDGRLDAVFSDIGPPLLYFGTDSPRMSFVGRQRGISPVATWSWGIVAADLDNDGDEDLLFQSWLIPNAIWASLCGGSCGFETLPQAETLLYRNNGEGYFSAETAAALPNNFNVPAWGVEHRGGGDALAVSDLNGDGLLDGVIARFARDPTGQLRGMEAFVLNGVAAKAGRWLTVEAPIGALVEVCVSDWCRHRPMLGARSFQSFEPPRLHFGLAGAPRARVAIRLRGQRVELGEFPSGAVVRAPSR